MDTVVPPSVIGTVVETGGLAPGGVRISMVVGSPGWPGGMVTVEIAVPPSVMGTVVKTGGIAPGGVLISNVVGSPGLPGGSVTVVIAVPPSVIGTVVKTGEIADTPGSVLISTVVGSPGFSGVSVTVEILVPPSVIGTEVDMRGIGAGVGLSSSSGGEVASMAGGVRISTVDGPPGVAGGRVTVDFVEPPSVIGTVVVIAGVVPGS